MGAKSTEPEKQRATKQRATAKCAAKSKAKAQPYAKAKGKAKPSPKPKGKAKPSPKSKSNTSERSKIWNRVYSRVYRQVRSAGGTLQDAQKAGRDALRKGRCLIHLCCYKFDDRLGERHMGKEKGSKWQGVGCVCKWLRDQVER